MRKLLFILLPFFFIAPTFGQHVCGTHPPTQEQYEYTRDVVSKISIQSNTGTICIPIRPHVIRRSDGTDGISMEVMNSGLTQLNEYYVEAGFEFYWCGTTPDYIDVDSFYDYNRSQQDALVATGVEVTNAINMYFLNSIASTTGGGLNGYANFPYNAIGSTRIFMRNGATLANNTMIHEMGHWLNLYHTHQDTQNGPSDPDAENVPRLPDPGANCDIAGDLICDTQADPRYLNADFDNANCIYTGSDTDELGNLYMPDIDNAMNYFPDGCQNPAVITPGQFMRAAQGFVIRQGHTAYTLDCAPIAVPVPTGLSVNLALTGIPVLNWTDNASGSTNDMGYLIERSETNTPTSWRTYRAFATATDGTTFSDDSELVIATTYYYRVKATNGDCNAYSNVASVVFLGGYCPTLANSCDESVDTVRVGTIDNGSNDCGTGNGYNNNTDISTDMFVGTSYPIEVISRNNYPGDRVGVWVDWNQDFDFDDADETILMTDPGTSPYTGTITPPSGAAIGSSVVMRVRIHFDDEVTTEACDTTAWGEVEDYAINIMTNECYVDAVSMGTQTACDPATNTYAQAITVAYVNEPASGSLVVNGQSFGITSSPQTVILTGLVADDNMVNVTALFSEEGTCTLIENSLFTSPADCTPSAINDATIENIRVSAIGNEIVIDLTNTVLEGSTETEIYNLLGQLLTKENLNNNSINSISIAEANNGYYVVKVINGNSSNTFKVLLSK